MGFERPAGQSRRTLSLFEQGDSRYREFWKQEEARAR